ncbi:hypothetical protein R1flu_019817 [Riccia fluitans]|uniref:Uncharacterized protein n=1 Tax=Riccia fluitans TaxID=41844 RepID=A0ABD1ZJR3_9MARC
MMAGIFRTAFMFMVEVLSSANKQEDEELKHKISTHVREAGNLVYSTPQQQLDVSQHSPVTQSPLSGVQLSTTEVEGDFADPVIRKDSGIQATASVPSVIRPHDSYEAQQSSTADLSPAYLQRQFASAQQWLLPIQVLVI